MWHVECVEHPVCCTWSAYNCAGWRRFTAQWVDCNKPDIVLFNVIIIIIIIITIFMLLLLLSLFSSSYCHHCYYTICHQVILNGQMIDNLMTAAKKMRNITGYSGPPCNVNPCMNGGVCIPVLNNAECRCPYNYMGQHCEKRNWHVLFFSSLCVLQSQPV